VQRKGCFTIGDTPIVSFDTSTHNELPKDSARAEIVLAALKSGLSFRFVCLSIDEMVATASPEKRAALFAYCSRIQDGLSECILSHDELTKRMVVEYHNNPAAFDWKRVDVKAREYERGIRSRVFSSRNCFASCASLTSIPLYFAFQA
jgi:hypothetical protein